MKKLFLALPVLGSVIGTLLTVLAYQDRRDHDWNDDYWHHHHYGAGMVSEATGVIGITSMNSSESARNLTAFERELRKKESLRATVFF
jgi:hypothetical protein